MAINHKLKLVLFEWLDSQGPDSGWRFLANENHGKHLDEMKCQSVGFLLFDGKDCKRIMPHISGALEALQRRGDLLIPTKAILSIKELAVKK